MEEKLQELKTRLAEVSDIDKTLHVLGWDQSTYMPPAGASARARQMATLGRLSQEKFTDPALGRLLDDLEPYAESLPFESDDASLIRVTRREYERMTKVPSEFMGKLYSHTAESYQAWTEARPNNDFDSMQPYLEKTLDLSRQLANYFPGYEHIADPLIDFADYGMRASTIQALFADLRAQLVPLVQAITAQEPADDSCLRGEFPEKEQLEFSREVVQSLGYDFKAGRLDITHHPFETSFSISDVRITTRIKTDFLGECLFSCIHEAGHGMYEQGIDKGFEATPLATGTSAGMHESQSRLWENLIGRSRGFWEFYFPRLKAKFPTQLSSTPLDTFYRAINKVERSLIRTDADEVTYNLHVMIRFDLELALLEGKLEIKDLPDAWNARYQSDLEIQAPDDRDGILQDVHWYAGIIGGAFQGYTLGNILGALIYQSALKKNPTITDEIAQGEFANLHKWLKENIYQHGSKFTANELVERITGGEITIDPYIQYLRDKYGELYPL